MGPTGLVSDVEPRVLAIFVGTAGPFPPTSELGTSGIRKFGVHGPVAVNLVGLSGDENVERPAADFDQAVCVYPSEHYEWWRQRYPAASSALCAGRFGENITLRGLTEHDVAVGDHYRVGSAVLVVSKPRGPCKKVAQHTGIPNLSRMMRRTLRTGWYARVASPGVLYEGCPWSLLERRPNALSVHATAEAMYLRRDDIALAKQALQCDGLAGNWRAVFAARVAGRPVPPL